MGDAREILIGVIRLLGDDVRSRLARAMEKIESNDFAQVSALLKEADDCMVDIIRHAEAAQAEIDRTSVT